MSIGLNNLVNYNLTTEAELTSILSNFNTEFIISIITDSIRQRLQINQVTNNNLVKSYEYYFKDLLNTYEDNKEDIIGTRNTAYIDIIRVICIEYNLTINYENIQDVFSCAYQLYDFLISNFKENIENFYVNFIFKEKNSIYNSLNLGELKKNKDTSTIYNKKIFKNSKLAVISSNIEYVIDAINTMDFSFTDVLNIIYPNDKYLIKTISNIVTPNGVFFKDFIVSAINSQIKAILLTNIRLKLQQLENYDIN